MSKHGKKTNRNWMSIIAGLDTNGSITRIRMGSPGSAQVTRHRLLAGYDGITISTWGNVVEISLT